MMDRRTDGWGAFQYLPARAFGATGDKKITDFARQNLSYKVDCVIVGRPILDP